MSGRGEGWGEMLQGEGGGCGVEHSIGTVGVTGGGDQRHPGDLGEEHDHHDEIPKLYTAATLLSIGSLLLSPSPSPPPTTITVISECVSA